MKAWKLVLKLLSIPTALIIIGLTLFFSLKLNNNSSDPNTTLAFLLLGDAIVMMLVFIGVAAIWKKL